MPYCMLTAVMMCSMLYRRLSLPLTFRRTAPDLILTYTIPFALSTRSPSQRVPLCMPALLRNRNHPPQAGRPLSHPVVRGWLAGWRVAAEPTLDASLDLCFLGARFCVRAALAHAAESSFELRATHPAAPLP